MSRTRKQPEKSPSERLRAIFYQHYVEQKSTMGFDDFYMEKMNKLIEHYKSKLKTQK
jgi:hypothetical protein